jgi:cysteine-rich repeat protein
MRVLSRGLVVVALALTACGDNLSAPSDAAPPDAGGVTLVSIAITPPAPSIADGTSVQLTATATFSDSTTSDVTATATWSSSDPTIATVTAGDVTGLDPGVATITATVGAVMGSTDVTVTDATLVSLELSPIDSSVALGFVWPFTATGTFSDSSVQDLTDQVTWSSSDETVATIDAVGVATTLAVGMTTIGADLAGVSEQTSLTVTDATLVSIQITPVDPSVALGVDEQFTATGTFSDTSTQDLTSMVTWASTDQTIATIDAAGLATTVATGTTTITASLGGVMGMTDLTVTTATLVSIQVTPVNPSIALGLDQQFTATGTFTDSTTQNLTTQVLWTSSVDTIAQISNAAGSEGLATSLALGTTTITAAMGAVMGATDLTVTDAALVSIDVQPDDPTVALGVDQQFTAIGTFTDTTTQNITTQVTWGSSDDTVAQISNAAGSEGLATTLATGTTTITATMGAISGSSDLTVSGATLVSIDVSPLDPSVSLGLDQQFTATGNFSDSTTQDLTTQVTWSSSDPTVAQISSAAPTEGLATTLATGTTMITATLGPISGSSDLTVTAVALVSIAVTPVDPTIGVGATQQFTATGTFSDTSTMDVTTQVLWESSLIGIAQISNAPGSEGLATGVGDGTTSITATSGTIVGSTSLTVTAVCGDGSIDGAETCDDGGTAPGDGCSATCAVETGWSCANEPSTCTPICGDGITVGPEPCDDMNMNQTDGCTSQCVAGVVCNGATLPGADAFAVDPATGNCYATWDSEPTTWAAAELACVAVGGHLAVITSASEHAFAIAAQVAITWIGATDDANDTDAIFTWVTGEPFLYASFAPGEPDDDGGLGGLGECLQQNAMGQWSDTNCDFVGFVTGRLCEIEADACGDGIVQGTEACDDGNASGSDGCSATCTVEPGAICSGVAPTTCAKLVINELEYDVAGTDNAEYIEIFNAGTATADLTDHAVVLMNGANNLQYGRVNLSGTLAGGGYAVLCPSTSLAGQCGPHALPNGTLRFLFAGATDQVQNGAPDAVGLFIIIGTVATPVDVVSYEGTVAMGQITGVTGTSPFAEGTGGAAADDNIAVTSPQRQPNGLDTQDNSTDFALRLLTPGAPTPP